MTNRVQPLFRNAQLTGRTEIVEVVEALDGRARIVGLPGVEASVVAGHLADVPRLRPGDRVLAVWTSQGAVVLGRLAAEDETPLPWSLDERGRVVLDAPAGLCLRCAEGSLEIDAEGRIRLDGREIDTIASRRLKLQGATIELN